MKKVIVVTGASSGFGALASRALASAGHTVYAGMRDTEGGTARQVVLAHEYAAKNGVDLRVVEQGPYVGLPDLILKGIASLEPADADVGMVAEAIVKVVKTPFGRRPFRVHIDPSQDGCEIVNGVADRVRAELLRNIGLPDLLTPRDLAAESQTAA
jgi:NAD(P)-dependent dehydrogenase (short-subunit alcohol dehydrogenase family)